MSLSVIVSNHTRVVSTAERTPDRLTTATPVWTSCGRPFSSAQHPHRVGVIDRLAENLAVDGHGRVGAEHPRLGTQREHGARLLDGEPLHVRGGRFVGMRRFVDVGRQHLEGDAGGGQQFCAPRRAARENYLAGWFSYHFRFAVEVPMHAMSRRVSSLRCATAHPAAAMLLSAGAASTNLLH